MKLVILKEPWITDKPYICVYDAGSSKPTLATNDRFASEAEARVWCEARVSGRERIAEYDLPEPARGA